MSVGTNYRGRLAPSPTGYLHLGHARTFATAQERARMQGGTLILRSEDLDRSRVRPEFCQAMLEDLRWAGFEWTEGPDVGGPYAPYVQSERLDRYRSALRALQRTGAVYPCSCTRKDILNALAAPHAGEEEPLYPGICRPRSSGVAIDQTRRSQSKHAWRFQVTEGERIDFIDGHFGPQSFVAGKDFGDFVVWRNDDLPAYQLAVVADDAAMGITEVVRGADLLLSTARQILLYRALGLAIPAFYHCPLVLDENGERLAKRHDALSLRTLRAEGKRLPVDWV
ncbi:MAG: tRNA glutamyl-Q(34) synthetase GluQRS [Verrucomicrobiales bacterium]|nr:tRNA glutamyl-Q(34) synthetase GluQRS [Verrucomicrobiales bacterium]